ncbi:MAG: choloylglycine hydrolase family protein [Eubacteriales bacterium]|nr:choloylglycine hydrolase family protein [Eubacteriales bacterium]
MCTAMLMTTAHEGAFFGRTMDFSYPLSPELYFVPQNFQWTNIPETHTICSKYAFMGIGQDISPVVFADGVNEMGFAAAALYFPDYAQYDSASFNYSSTPPIAAVELVAFLLGQSPSVDHALSLLRSIKIIGTEDSVTNTVAPLHWLIADTSGRCVTVEKTADGLHLTDNPVGVLSNSPDFQWHMTNLRNYMNVSQFQTQEKHWNFLRLTPFGQGNGGLGLPGDYTPPSRFIKTAFQKTHVSPPSGRKEAVSTCFHILDGVSIPKGCVMTHRETADYTQYTAFIDLSTKEYFYKTYENSRIFSVRFPDEQEHNGRMISLGKLQKDADYIC